MIGMGADATFAEIAGHTSPEFVLGLKVFLRNVRDEQRNGEEFYQRMSKRVNGTTIYDFLKRNMRNHVEHHLTFLGERGFLNTGSKVLDVGCGTGLEAVFFGQAVGTEGKVIGVDSSEPLVRVARERAERYGLSNTAFVVGDRDRLGFPDGYFDSLICIHALTEGENYNFPEGDIFYLSAVRERAGNFGTVLRPGGKIFLSIPIYHPSPRHLDYECDRIHNVVRGEGFGNAEREHVTFSTESGWTIGSLMIWGEKD